MRDRHWRKVKDTIGRDFDQNSEEFTLDAIADMQMQNYAEYISEISNAATMELAIEVVREEYYPNSKLSENHQYCQTFSVVILLIRT